MRASSSRRLLLPCALALHVDDATFGRVESVAVTPAPATLALLAGGLALPGMAERGRRRDA